MSHATRKEKERCTDCHKSEYAFEKVCIHDRLMVESWGRMVLLESFKQGKQMKAKIYQYEKCSTCRKAIAWLRENGIEFTSIPIRERTPTKKELKTMVKAHDGEVRKLFNTSSKDYRDPELKELLPTLSEDQTLDLLRERGNLIKRPFVIADGIALQGFKVETWEKAFSG